MRLLIDVGNSRVKWAIVAATAAIRWDALHGVQAGWLAIGAVAHANLGQLAAQWRANLLSAAGESSAGQISNVVVANVAGTQLGAALLDQLAQVGIAANRVNWFASVPSLSGIQNGYRDPAQLGCDRFAAMIGARALFGPHALIVASCGTATTIDAVESDGAFIGGMILPGVSLMTRALARHTAQLPAVDPTRGAPQRFADNTDAAIVSGVREAQCGAIERAWQALPNALCILSGGAAALLAPALTIPHHLIDHLVLLGLQAATPPGARLP
ncbi:MAG: type III pantothenate kinase [Pseudomonadota bacterium]|nr:type III pantothenate kinase [Pseudomonadota bacterium]